MRWEMIPNATEDCRRKTHQKIRRNFGVCVTRRSVHGSSCGASSLPKTARTSDFGFLADGVVGRFVGSALLGVGFAVAGAAEAGVPPAGLRVDGGGVVRGDVVLGGVAIQGIGEIGSMVGGVCGFWVGVGLVCSAVASWAKSAKPNTKAPNQRYFFVCCLCMVQTFRWMTA